MTGQTGYENGDVRNLGDKRAIYYQGEIFYTLVSAEYVSDTEITDSTVFSYIGVTSEVYEGRFKRSLESWQISSDEKVYYNTKKDYLLVEEADNLYLVLNEKLP